MSGLTWRMRPRPDAAALSSAWLIRRFVDPEARFEFSEEPDGLLDRCTFQGLCDVFRLNSAAIARLARIVHDLEYADGRVDTLKAARVDGLLADLRVGHQSDDVFLAHGMVLFESLYLACELSEANDEPTTSLTDIPRWSNG